MFSQRKIKDTKMNNANAKYAFTTPSLWLKQTNVLAALYNLFQIMLFPF